MLIVGSLDFIAATVGEINADGPWSGRLAAVLILAAILFPCFFDLIPIHNISKYEALIYFPLCFPPVIAYMHLRREQIDAIRGRISKPIAPRLRGIVALSLITAGVATAFAARHSSLAAVSALLGVLSLPWSVLSGLQRAP